MKKKIAITIDSKLLEIIDNKVDKIKYKNRSHIIENLIRKWLNLKKDVWAVIIANENRWDIADSSDKYPFTFSKALIQIDWKYIIEKHIENLITAWVTKIIIAYSSETKDIKNHLESTFNKNILKFIKNNINIDYIEVSKNDDSWIILEIANAVLNTKKIITILSDNYFVNLNLTDVLESHNNQESKLTIIVKPDFNLTSYWNIELKWNKIINFQEKPPDLDSWTWIINTWIYIIESSIITNKWENYKLEYDFLPNYIKKFKANAYFHNSPYFHIQSNKILEELNIIY